MTWLLRLYPRAWRERYGAEMADLVASQPRTLQLAIDLVGGAIDAHWNHHAFARRMEGAAEATTRGGDMVTRLMHCEPRRHLTPRETAIAASISIAGALVIAALQIIWRDSIVAQMSLVMLPGVWLLATQPFYLRGHSTRAKLVLLGGPLLVLLLIAASSVYIARMI
jgi:hypothetical protein